MASSSLASDILLADEKAAARSLMTNNETNNNGLLIDLPTQSTSAAAAASAAVKPVFLTDSAASASMMQDPLATSLLTAATVAVAPPVVSSSWSSYDDWQVVDSLSPEETQHAQEILSKQQQQQQQQQQEQQQTEEMTGTKQTKTKPLKSRKAQKWKDRLAKKGVKDNNTAVSATEEDSGGDNNNNNATTQEAAADDGARSTDATTNASSDKAIASSTEVASSDTTTESAAADAAAATVEPADVLAALAPRLEGETAAASDDVNTEESSDTNNNATPPESSVLPPMGLQDEDEAGTGDSNTTSTTSNNNSKAKKWKDRLANKKTSAAEQELEAKRKAEGEQQQEEEARLKAEEAARLKAEEEARLKAEQEARLTAEEEARLKAEQEARLKAEQEARLKAEEEARLKAEQEGRLKAEEEARLKAEEKGRLKAGEEARLKAEEKGRLKAGEEARLKAEEEARLKAEEESRQRLTQTYQEIAEEKRKKEAAERDQAEKHAEDERQAKEAERFEKIQQLEEERKQVRLEEQRKAREELQQASIAGATAPLGSSETRSTPSSGGGAKSMIVLVSNSFGTPAQRTNQDRAITSLNAKGIVFEQVDGSDPAMKDRRNELFGISGLRGKYPQFFQKENDQISFLGDFETFEGMNEADTLSELFPPHISDSSKETASSRSIPTSSSSSSSSKVMIVLVSKSFGSLAQRTSQDRALTMLAAKGIPVEEVDGSDPALKDRRNELFEMSGLRGKYPQFFVRDGSTTTFLGDFETFDYLNETGGLVETFNSDAAKEVPAVAADPPAATNKLMIVLVSKSFGTLAQKTNQERTTNMLTGNKIPFEEVDGSDPALKDRRNELFEISGLRGNYPQLFVQDGDQISFLGDFETLEALNDAGTLSPIFSAGSEETAPDQSSRAANEPATAFCKVMIALVSKSFGSIAQRTNQDRAMTMLNGKKIPFEEVDGSDPANKDLRNKLFSISGIRGNYPQFFLKEGSETAFLGDFETIQAMNEAGELSTSLLGHVQKEEAPLTPVPSRGGTVRHLSTDSQMIPGEVWENEYETTPRPAFHSRSMSRDSEIAPDETFENEFSTTPCPEYTKLRSLSRDSEMMPGETFENEFENEFDEQPPPPPLMPAKLGRLDSEDSTRIPSESFENEYEDVSGSVSSSRRLGRMSTSEQVFQPVVEGSPAAESGVDEPNTSRSLLVDTSISENKSLEEERKTVASPRGISPAHLHLALGALGVAVVVGMWWASHRG